METRQDFQDMELQRKLAALTALALNYGKDFPKPLVKTWVRLLEPYSAAQVEQGVDLVIAEYEYKTLPLFAVLSKAIQQACGFLGQKEAIGVSALQEWENVLNLARSQGRAVYVRFEPITEKVIRIMGGWDAVCDWREDSLDWKRKEFLEHYERIAQNHELLGLPAPNLLSLAGAPARQRERLPQGPSHIGGAISNFMSGVARAS